MLGIKLDTARPCWVTKELLSVDSFPYELVGPYSICESLASSVVQVMVAFVELMLMDATLEMIGGVVSLVSCVVKLTCASVPGIF